LYRLKISKLYKEDTSSSYNYIKYKLEAPMAANNLKKEMKEQINKIKVNPRIRPLVKDEYLANLGYRLINVKNFMIFYIIDDDNKRIKIIRFLYGKRDWINILKETPLDEIG
jgi:plasmid stabilization system protein ParE